MRLQAIKYGPGRQPTVISDVPWHDAASNGGDYRDRLMQSLGGYFEADEKGMQAKAELAGGGTAPDELRLIEDDGTVIQSYGTADLERDTGMTITIPTQADLDADRDA